MANENNHVPQAIEDAKAHKEHDENPTSHHLSAPVQDAEFEEHDKPKVNLQMALAFLVSILRPR